MIVENAGRNVNNRSILHIHSLIFHSALCYAAYLISRKLAQQQTTMPSLFFLSLLQPDRTRRAAVEQPSLRIYTSAFFGSSGHHVMTLTFDLVTSKSSQFIFVLKWWYTLTILSVTAVPSVTRKGGNQRRIAHESRR